MANQGYDYNSCVPLRSPLPRKDRSSYPDDTFMDQRIVDLHYKLEQKIENDSKNRMIRVVLVMFETLCLEIIQSDWKDSSLMLVYMIVPVPQILLQNEEACTDTVQMRALKDAIGILFRYGVNLLKPDVTSSSTWRVISFDNPMYNSRVSILKGHQKILSLYGYTKEMSYGLSYPDASLSPNTETVAKVAADLAIAYFEIDLYITGKHQFPRRIDNWLILHGTQFPNRTKTFNYSHKHFPTTPPSYGSYSSKNLLPDEPIMQQTKRSAAIPHVKSSYPVREPEDLPKVLTASVGQEKQSSIDDVAGKTLLPQQPSQSMPFYNQVNIKLTKCGICKQNPANMRCNVCSQPRCQRCDELWHKHPQRQGHKREPIILEELGEYPKASEPAADIPRDSRARALPVVIDKAAIRKAHLPGGSAARTDNLSPLPEEPLSRNTMGPARTNDLSDSLPLLQGKKLIAETSLVNCDFCETKPGKKRCTSCGETYCLECDDKRHSNQHRKNHIRQDVTQIIRPGNLPSNQNLDSMVSSYYSAPGVGCDDASFINSEEGLDLRAPPHDRYLQPVEKATVDSGVHTELGHNTPQTKESPSEFIPHLQGEGMAPQGSSGAVQETKFQEELGKITAEDITTMEKLFSVRGLRESEMDPGKKAALLREEQELTRKHEEFQRKLKALQGQSSGTPGTSPLGVQSGAAVTVGSAGAANTVVPQGMVVSSVTSAGNMTPSVSPVKIRQKFPDAAEPQEQNSRDIVQGDQEEGWTCQHCTFLNTNMESNICEVCDKTSFPNAKIQQKQKPKGAKSEQSNPEVKVQPLTKAETRLKNAEYFQQLEAEMLAEKRQAKQEFHSKPESFQTELAIQEPKKTVAKSKPLSDTDLLEIAQAIPTSYFTKLGFELGFSHNELRRLQVKDPRGISGGATFEMLKMWTGDVRGQEQRPKLKEALLNAGLRAYVEFLDENRFIRDEPLVSSPRPKATGNVSSRPSRMFAPSGMTSDAVSDKELMQLARMIPVSKIHDLGFNLGFSYQEVRSLMQYNRMDSYHAIFNMLQDWKMRTSGQHRKLNCALIESELGGLTLSEPVPSPNDVTKQPRGITDMELQELADSLNASDIRELGMYLGFGMAAISRYQQQAAMGSPREGTVKMLQDWIEQEPEIDHRECLANVLDQIDCMRLGEKIRTYSESTHHFDTFEESLQQQLSHATSFGDLSYVKDEVKMKYEEKRTASLKLIAELREAESQGILPGHIKCALYLMEEQGDDLADPIAWIDANWTNVINDLAQKATQELKENLEVDVDKRIIDLVQLSVESAEKCLEDCSGNIQEAVKDCTQTIQEKILEIQEVGCYSVDDIVAILKQADVRGDPEKALDALQAKAMAEYADRVWKPMHGDDNEYFQQAIKNDDRSIRMLMVEYNMFSWGRAQTAAKLIIRREFSVDDVVTAAEECGDLRRSEEFLKQQCSVCFDDLPRNKLISLINCQCMMCRGCVIQHFEIIAKDQSIMKGKCPTCDQPDLDDPAVAANYFSFLDILLREMLTAEVFELFQRKLRDWNLMQDENFCWCAHCNSGFINGAPDRRKMRCPECNKLTCFHCRKQWMEQHEGISCEAFQQWKENNDPDLQAQGLAAHLNENGIECPRCKMRYELAKGGCMHFKCPQCTFEFCCGCNQPIKRGEACAKFASCLNRGLHAHHPRDCLFYLRDEDIAYLQNILEDEGVEFNKEPPQGAEENEEGKCGVQEQKEGPNGLEDNKCGRNVTPGNAGLCRIHYIEYLVGLINGKNIDPSKNFPIAQLEVILNREEIAVPIRRPGEADPDYRRRLLQEVQTKLPLKKLSRDRAR
ncbi:uncharacterized protein LOC129253840 [Lytechinus pictus]|uniref:uncharacterized protein LOC129253840 n=1 Tax=Lytechinus pictus TaxID=7653 RepID=UPI0030B9E10D